MWHPTITGGVASVSGYYRDYETDIYIYIHIICAGCFMDAWYRYSGEENAHPRTVRSPAQARPEKAQQAL